MPIQTIPESVDRDRIKNLVATGDIDEIQTAMDTNQFRRKQHTVKEVDMENKTIVFTATTDTIDRDGERGDPPLF